MIEHYTIKFGLAVSQKELEKAFNAELSVEQMKKMHLLKARIELVGSIEDLKKVRRILEEMSSQRPSGFD